MLYSQFLKLVFRVLHGAPPDRPLTEGANLVLVADGVGGLDLCGTGLRSVMATSGSPDVVKVVPWGHGFGRWHADLTNVANRDAQARLIADQVLENQAKESHGSVFLVGKSGGTGLVVKALEMLPEDAVEATVLLSPALSPNYDLTLALRAVRREMVAFWSPLDVFVLGLGTKLFGTIDRVHDVSAGLVGFNTREGEAYAKLKQIRWQPGMATTGYLGGHVGPDSPAFLRKYVLPILVHR
jgi:alpha-beta hydrolase superfamily lysophospholipase